MLSLSHWIGGDARRRRESERGTFRANLFAPKVPRSLLGDLVARVAPVFAECPQMVRSRGTRTSNHLRPRPAPDGARKGNFWRTSRLERSGNSPSKAKGLRTTKSMRRAQAREARPKGASRSEVARDRARGWEAPEAAVGTSKAQRQRRQRERGRAIVGKTRRALQRRRRAQGIPSPKATRRAH